jgi:O-antigen/teichoic acid export membrane protein
VNFTKLGPLLSYAATYISIASSLLTSIILARILTPDEIGVASVAFALIALANLFRDLGLASFIHTSRELPDHVFRTCLGVSMIIGLTLAGIIALSSLLLSTLANDSRIAETTLALSLNFLLIPPQAIVFAVLVRGGKHLRVFAGITSAALLNLIFSWWLAHNGYSYLSAPLASVASSFFGLIIVFLLRNREYSVQPHLKRAQEVISISVHPFISGIAKTGTERAPELSMAALGSGLDNVAYYEKAASATELGRRLIFDSIAQIFTPALRRASEAEESFRRVATDYLSLASLLGLPLTIGMLLSAEPLIIILFGEKWRNTIPILNALALSIPFAFLIATTSQLAFFRSRHAELTRILIPARILETTAVIAATTADIQWIAPTVVASECMISLLLLIVFSETYDRRQLLFQSLLGLALAGISLPGAAYLAMEMNRTAQSSMIRLIVPSAALTIVWLIVATPIYLRWRKRLKHID